jgi:hypothetical protein
MNLSLPCACAAANEQRPHETFPQAVQRKPIFSIMAIALPADIEPGFAVLNALLQNEQDNICVSSIV